MVNEQVGWFVFGWLVEEVNECVDVHQSSTFCGRVLYIDYRLDVSTTICHLGECFYCSTTPRVSIHLSQDQSRALDI